MTPRKILQTRNRDFVALFNSLWYRDFPIDPGRLDINKRALWTQHIANVVKGSADLLGLYTCYETGGKTDAVIEDQYGKKWAKVEWEWFQPHSPHVNEIDKLAACVDDADVFIYIGYGRLDVEDHSQLNMDKIRSRWRGIDKPLFVFMVTFNRITGYGRDFFELETHVFRGNIDRKLRSQPALPWKYEGTKWYRADA